MKKIVQLLILLSAYNIGFSQAGSLDTSFSHNGIIKTQFNHTAVLHALALQSDGKIIAVGTVDSSFTIVRYKTNGLTDKSFGDNGIVKGFRGAANAVAIQDDGQIIVAGTVSYGQSSTARYDISIARYKTNGSIDSGFGENGSLIIDINSTDYCNAVAVQKDGKIVLAGTALIRLNNNGSYDTNFGDGGKVIPVPDSSGYTIPYYVIRTLALQKDGKIIIGGAGANGYNYELTKSILMRFKRNGDIDTSFGDEGTASFDGFPINDIALQTNGKIMCAGNGSHVYWKNDGEYYFLNHPAFTRYTADGNLDTTYNPVQLYPEGSNVSGMANSIALLPDDKPVIALQYYKSDTTLGVFKFNAKGKKDLSFGRNGDKVFTNPYLQYDYYNFNYRPSKPILVQPDGKIVVGSTYNSSGFYIARLLGSKSENENIYSAARAVKNIKPKASIYPNPSHNIITVKGLDATTSFRLTITDMQGRMYKSADVKNSSSFNFNIQNLPPATYMLTIQNATSTETINFIKQ